jgi:hypothetical protein
MLGLRNSYVFDKLKINTTKKYINKYNWIFGAKITYVFKKLKMNKVKK